MIYYLNSWNSYPFYILGDYYDLILAFLKFSTFLKLKSFPHSWNSYKFITCIPEIPMIYYLHSWIPNPSIIINSCNYNDLLPAFFKFQSLLHPSENSNDLILAFLKFQSFHIREINDLLPAFLKFTPFYIPKILILFIFKE